MLQESVVESVQRLVGPILQGLGLELVDLEFKHEGRDWMLRLFIDKDGGVSLDDCVQVSRELGAVLEIEDVIETAYRLEVSSPGLDRPLNKSADYQKYAGRLVKVKTFAKLDPDGRGHERKTFVGILLGLENGLVRIEQNDKRGGIIELELSQIAKANLEVEF